MTNIPKRHTFGSFFRIQIPGLVEILVIFALISFNYFLDGNGILGIILWLSSGVGVILQYKAKRRIRKKTAKCLEKYTTPYTLGIDDLAEGLTRAIPITITLIGTVIYTCFNFRNLQLPTESDILTLGVIFVLGIGILIPSTWISYKKKYARFTVESESEV